MYKKIINSEVAYESIQISNNKENNMDLEREKGSCGESEVHCLLGSARHVHDPFPDWFPVGVAWKASWGTSLIHCWHLEKLVVSNTKHTLTLIWWFHSSACTQEKHCTGTRKFPATLSAKTPSWTQHKYLQTSDTKEYTWLHICKVQKQVKHMGHERSGGWPLRQ